MHTNEEQKLIANVAKELAEMKKLGMNVPFDPAALTDKQKADIIEFHAGGMSNSEIADLLIDLA